MDARDQKKGTERPADQRRRNKDINAYTGKKHGNNDRGRGVYLPGRRLPL